MDQAGSAESTTRGRRPGAETHEDQLHEWERERLAKVERLRAENVEPYARSFPDRTPLADIVEKYGYVETGQTAEGTHFRVAGRVMSRRRHGKALFLTLRDDWYELQVYSNVEHARRGLVRAADRRRPGRHHRVRGPRVPHPHG